MRRLIVACTATLLFACEGQLEENVSAVLPELIPTPHHTEVDGGVFELKSGATITAPERSGIVESADWIAELIEDQTGLSLRVSTEEQASIRLELVDSDSLQAAFAANDLVVNAESYALTIDSSGVRIRATESAGLFYGLTTLWQLLTDERNDRGVLPKLRILDSPNFAWRGLMLDSARHMQSAEFIKRYIDWMSLHKLNVFHWHLTDDQAWRLEIRKYPRLTEVGGWRVPAGDAPAADIDDATGSAREYGGFYTQETVREIVAHAAMRHVTIVPEIDVPGHASAAIAAYPELGVAGHPVSQVPANWGIYENVFNLEENTFTFLEDVLFEVTELFPGQFIHLGGDEVVTRQWETSERIALRMRQLGIDGVQALQNYYVERLQTFLAKLDRKVIGWDEVLESDLPEEAAVMSWRGVDGAIAAAAKGHQTVLSPAPTFYLDHIQTDAVDAPPGRGGVITVRDIYEFDLLPESLEDDREFLLGVQGNLWTEHVRTEKRAAYMTYPRAAAIAELAWTASRDRDWSRFARSLEVHSNRLRALGIAAAEVGTEQNVKANNARVEDRELELCGNAIVLALEDDAPLTGTRESFLVDIMNPCWILRNVDLGVDSSVKASVGQVPFNFEIGDMIHDVVVESSESDVGELRVRLGSCTGPIVASLPLTPAIGRHTVTELPPVHFNFPGDAVEADDLCFQFARADVDPIWVIDWVQVSAGAQGNIE